MLRLHGNIQRGYGLFTRLVAYECRSIFRAVLVHGKERKESVGAGIGIRVRRELFAEVLFQFMRLVMRE